MPEPESAVPQEMLLTAVGRVAGGIVHDANNALTVVVANLDRAARTLAADSKSAEHGKAAAAAAMKAAALLRRVLEYAAHRRYDPDLVDLDDLLSRLFAKGATADGDVRVEYRPGGVGPALVDERLLELAMLDFVAGLSPHLGKDGAIAITAANLGPNQTPPGVPDARIVLTANCRGLTGPMPALRGTLLHRIAALAGGGLTVAETPAGGEVRLYLPGAGAGQP